ncbi:NAD+ diphosphatase [Celeribacter marinus]|uniref:NAD(+) diphosphatase n=1 Tax=Celeribacter marinus TaxID=1397108 RepID=A0A0P0AAM3_9RHOB|nr:NADH pyrophosphatase [Celeribacter marinus]SFK09797.1 NAD+ diphosphatase [Celeribacter marinus]
MGAVRFGQGLTQIDTMRCATVNNTTQQTDDAVTLGAGTLDRAAHLRGDAASLWAQNGARVLPLWSHKPFCNDSGGLAFLETDHPTVVDLAQDAIFMGIDDAGAAVFAVDVTRTWTVTQVAELQEGFLDPSQQRVDGLPDCAFLELRAVMTLLSPWEAEVASTARGLLEWHGRHGFCAACGAKSAMTQAGWQRTCSSCSAPHFPRTDPVVIMLVTRGNSVLLGRNENWPEGMYSLLAGFVEPGEPIEAAVRREVFEESGIVVADVTYIASQPWPFPASLMIGCAARATSETITIDPLELQDAMWVTREDVALSMAGMHPTLKPARKGAIAHYLLAKWLADEIE